MNRESDVDPIPCGDEKDSHRAYRLYLPLSELRSACDAAKIVPPEFRATCFDDFQDNGFATITFVAPFSKV